MTNQKLSRIQKAAKAYLKNTKWSLFLLAEGTKVPLEDSGGWKDASNDPEEVLGWLEYNPNFNLAAATGPISGDLIVIDTDLYKEGVKEARAALEARYGPFPKTLAAISPRGGTHEYFYNAKGVHIGCANTFPGGMDLRGEGGHIVLPPSSVGGVEYRWKGQPDFNKIADAPDWMYQFFGPKRDAGGRFVAKSTDEWSRLAQPVTEGGRHERMLIIIGFLLRIMRPQAPLAEALAHGFNRDNCRPPLPTSEVQHMFEDIANKELSKLEKALGGGAR